jgi:FKBP12-rapamycin complex-associated protein
MQTVEKILSKLLSVAITDTSPIIRETVLASLDSRFDHHLAQAEHIKSIFLSLKDEVFSVRELSVDIIGRLALHNPAYVLPSLRKTLIHLLTELEFAVLR